jgi:hypothetical protein
MRPEIHAEPEKSEREIERLSEELRDQMRFAKERISDRYGKLMEERSFEPGGGEDEGD